MLLIHPGDQSKSESGSKAQSYYSAEQARESGCMLPHESISTATF